VYHSGRASVPEVVYETHHALELGEASARVS